MKKLIIVGAGASGLAAASRLVQKGFKSSNLIILEAQNRIGGRIHTLNEGMIIVWNNFPLILRLIGLSFMYNLYLQEEIS